MKRYRILMLVLGLLLTLAPAGKFGLAQEAEPPSYEMGDVTLAATVAERISYQGYLEQGGNPMTGSVNLTFTLYSDDTCTTDVETIVKNSVPVSGGYFTTELDVTQANFNGQGLWIGVEASGNDLGCQEILPVPYALSLRPGAKIEGAPGLTGHLVGASTVGGDIAGSLVQGVVLGGAAVYGKNATIGMGVYGESSHASGYGGYFTHSGGGTALMVAGSGIIESTAETEIAVSPLKTVVDPDSAGNPEVRPHLNGNVVLRPSASGEHYAYLPVDLPSQIFGVSQKLDSITVCYDLDQSSSYINDLFVYYTDEDGRVELIFDPTNRTSTVWDCYTVSDPSPGVIDGPVFIRFDLQYSASGSSHDIHIGKIVLTLVE